MDMLFKSNRTHRSCFRRLILTFLDREYLKIKNGAEIAEENPELVAACFGIFFLNFKFYKLYFKKWFYF